MSTYVSITISRYGKGCSDLDHGSMTISTTGGLQVYNHNLTVQNAMKEMTKLSKLLDKTPTMEINQYNPEISYLHLYGFID